MKEHRSSKTIYTLAPLLGPIGGGLAAFGAGFASPSAGAVVVVVVEASGGVGGGGGGGGGPSSAARTTSLLEILFPCLEEKATVFLGVELGFGAKLDFSTNPDAAHAMLHVAIITKY